ncbi:MAG TPA: YggS family pyridoxal phosphate-dependent enzyme [Flavisolibacter sp.]
MPINTDQYLRLKKQLDDRNVTLVAVSKIQPVQKIMELYKLGHRDFGENYVQELVDKYEKLPKDIRWHFIGHLQRNKVKYIAPFVHLVHGVDSYKLLEEINRQAAKAQRTIDCLLQVHIAKEETKFGLSAEELEALFSVADNHYRLNQLSHVTIKGLMGMASFSDDMQLVREEFRQLKKIFDQCNRLSPSNQLGVLSLGMSADYEIAMEEGSTMVRIGSLLFGARVL